MKKIAVLLDSQILNDGRVRRVIESLSEKFLVDFFCVKGESDDSLLFNKNVEIFYYSIDISWVKHNLFMHKKFEDLKIQFKKLKKKYDFIYVNDYPLLSTGVELKNKIDGKLIYDSHEIYIETINQFFPSKTWKKIYGIPLIKVNQLIHSKIEKKQVKQIDKMVTVCDSLKNYFEKKLPVKDVIVMRNCPKHFDFNTSSTIIRNKLNLSDKVKILLYQGDVNISRGIEKIAKAIPLVNENIHFVIIGGGTKLNEFKEKYSSNRIHFLGRIAFDDLYEYTASCDVGISIIEPYNLSKYYSLPNKIFEYMVANVPFITNNLPEASKIAKEENCGFIINDSSSEKIAEEINDIFNKSNLKEFGKNGHKAIVEKYNWEKEVSKVIKWIMENS